MGRIMERDYTGLVEMINQGVSVRRVADAHHCGRSSVYRIYQKATKRHVSEQYRLNAVNPETHPIYQWRAEIGLGGEVIQLNEGMALLVIQP